jgi:hypothetical protein
MTAIDKRTPISLSTLAIKVPTFEARPLPGGSADAFIA